MAVLNKIDIGLDQKLSVPEVISNISNIYCLVSYLQLHLLKKVQH